MIYSLKMFQIYDEYAASVEEFIRTEHYYCMLKMANL